MDTARRDHAWGDGAVTSTADQLRLLLPPVSYNVNGPNLSAVIEAEGKALDALVADSQYVYDTIFPDSGVGLDDWERVLGLPDPCVAGEPQTREQRIKSVVSKLSYRGGQSREFFIGLAKALGFDVSISTFRPALAGIASAGDAINGGDWAFTWRVNAPMVNYKHATAGISVSGDPLASWGSKALECRFSQLQPAESILIFGYGVN